MLLWDLQCVRDGQYWKLDFPSQKVYTNICERFNRRFNPTSSKISWIWWTTAFNENIKLILPGMPLQIAHRKVTSPIKNKTRTSSKSEFYISTSSIFSSHFTRVTLSSGTPFKRNYATQLLFISSERLLQICITQLLRDLQKSSIYFTSKPILFTSERFTDRPTKFE